MNPPTKISYHAGKRLYRKTIGKYKKADGTLVPRDFWLGADQVQALYLASRLVRYWKQDLEPYGLVWDDQHEKDARELAEAWQWASQCIVDGAAAQAADSLRTVSTFGTPVTLPAPFAPGTNTTVLAPTTPAEPEAVTLEQAAARYAATMKAKRQSFSHVARFQAVMKQVYEVLPGNTPLKRIGHEQLVGLVGHFLARPTSKLTGKPLAVESVKRVFQYTKMLLDDVDGDDWEGPRKWPKLFKVRWATLMTPAEQKKQAQGKATFTNDELKELYALAGDRTRMLMLLGLNCGLHQMEIATLQLDEIDLTNGVIDRIRHKTRGTAAVRTRWVLWPETLKLVKAHLAAENAAGLAFLSEQGRPLVNNDAHTDSVALAWARLLKHAKNKGKKVRTLRFGTLRKTSATEVLRISGSERVQEQQLGHSTQSVAGKHYTGAQQFTELSEALQRYRQELIDSGVLPAKAAKEPILVPTA